MIKLGVDNGNYNTKSSGGMLYPSGYTVGSTEFVTSEMQLSYGGKYYAVGGQRLHLQRDKTKEQDAFILTLPAIAEAMKKAGNPREKIILGVGLPVDSYGTQKEAFRNYFLRDNISFLFEGASYQCSIVGCEVYAQGHAALCRYYPQLKGYHSITLVDIGGYTVDILTFHDFQLDRSSCASLRMGTITLYNHIQDVLQGNDILLNDGQITDAISGRIQHTDKETIEAVVEQAVKVYCKELFNALRERGLDLKLPTVFAGGGAELLEPWLHGSDINTVAVLDRFANADGYKLLLG